MKDEVKYYTVYQHIFPNNKVYIGMTSQELKMRWKNGNAYRRQIYLFRAIKKYGWNNIEHKILLTNLSKEEAESEEIRLISKYKSNKKQYGYNIENGGSCATTHSLITRKKISKKLKGRKLSETTKNKMRKRMIGNKYNLGRKMPKEHLEKLNLINSVPIAQYDSKNNLIKEYVSLREAERVTKILSSHISQVSNGKRHTAGGYVWKKILS